MKNFPGVYPEGKRYRAFINLEEKKYHLGTYLTPEKAYLKVRLFLHWLKIGFKADEIPRLWQPEVVEQPIYKPFNHDELSRVIKNNGVYPLKPEDILNIATELLELRLFKYGPAKTVRFGITA